MNQESGINKFNFMLYGTRKDMLHQTKKISEYYSVFTLIRHLTI